MAKHPHLTAWIEAEVEASSHPGVQENKKALLEALELAIGHENSINALRETVSTLEDPGDFKEIIKVPRKSIKALELMKHIRYAIMTPAFRNPQFLRDCAKLDLPFKSLLKLYVKSLDKYGESQNRDAENLGKLFRENYIDEFATHFAAYIEGAGRAWEDLSERAAELVDTFLGEGTYGNENFPQKDFLEVLNHRTFRNLKWGLVGILRQYEFNKFKKNIEALSSNSGFKTKWSKKGFGIYDGDNCIAELNDYDHLILVIKRVKGVTERRELETKTYGELEAELERIILQAKTRRGAEDAG